MLGALFGDIVQGRLSRLPFFGYLALLTAIVLAIGFGLVAVTGAAEHLANGDLRQTQALLAERFGVPLVIVMVIVGVLLLFAQLNITAKRARDTGLPGWLTVAVIVLVPSLLGGMISQQTASALNLLFIVALLLIPSGAFTRGG